MTDGREAEEGENRSGDRDDLRPPRELTQRRVATARHSAVRVLRGAAGAWWVVSEQQDAAAIPASSDAPARALDAAPSTS